MPTMSTARKERRLIMATIVGLTGGIASGKSTVSDLFKQAEIPVIDTDQIARKLLEQDEVVFETVVKTFGEDVLTPSKAINRNKLAQIIFYDDDKRQALNDIVHPKVKDRVFSEIDRLKADHDLIVVDVPLLFEAEFDKFMDHTVVVYAKRKDQISRLMSREGIDEAYAKQKVKSQMPLSQKKTLADYVIDNSKSILETRKCFDRLLKKLKATASKGA